MDLKAHSRQKGYSLAEALVVVAIIGIFSLIAIPNFITMLRSARVKTSLRQLTTDLRSARQRAVTRDLLTKVTIIDGTKYEIFEGTLNTDGTVTWAATPYQKSELDSSVAFTSTGSWGDVDGDSLKDIVFQGNGTVRNIPDPVTGAYLKIKCSYDIPRPEYTITLSAAGRVAAS